MLKNYHFKVDGTKMPPILAFSASSAHEECLNKYRHIPATNENVELLDVTSDTEAGWNLYPGNEAGAFDHLDNAVEEPICADERAWDEYHDDVFGVDDDTFDPSKDYPRDELLNE